MTLRFLEMLISCLALVGLSRADTVVYKLDESWPRNSSQFTAPIFSVAVNQQNGDVFVAKRNTNSSDILQFSRAGDYIRTLPITDAPLSQVHGITLQYDYGTGDPLGLWATDVGDGKFGHTVKQYNLDGSLVQVLGTSGVAGTSLDPIQFDHPAEVAFDDQNLMYIVDGDGGLNNRMIKLGAGYNVQWSFGKNGTGSQGFRIPHSVAVLPREGIACVADRMNNRLQAFDIRKPNPRLIGSCQMTGGQPYSVRFSPDASHLIVTQLNNDTIAFVSLSSLTHARCQILGEVKLQEGSKPHLVDVDLTTGAFYVGLIGTTPNCLRYVPAKSQLDARQNT